MPKCLLSIITLSNYLILLSTLSTTNSTINESPKKTDLITFYIQENSPIGTIVGQIQSPEFPPPYDIHDFQDRKFLISHTTGIIHVADSIDREKQDLYSFLIISHNGDTKSIQIKLIDMNDNEPKFNATNLEKSIPENYPIGSKVDLTTVYDPDDGKNTIQSVKITSGDSDKNFAIDYHDNSNGLFYLRLIVKQTLDFESISQYNLVIQAVDGGSPPLQSTLIVRILIQNANDNVPKFDISRYLVSIPENQLVNRSFLQVRATDNDAGPSGELFYFLDNQSSIGNRYFSVNQKSGDVSLTRSLDFEKIRSHRISIVVRDNSPPFHTSKVPVIIDVVDVNDNAPNIHVVWTERSAIIHRNIEHNSIVAHIKVTDDDTISTGFDLSIVDQSPFQLVKILPKLWELRIVNDVNDFERDYLNLTLEARDLPEPSLVTISMIHIRLQQSVLKEIAFKQRLYSVEFDEPILRANQVVMVPEIVRTLPWRSNFSFVLSNEKDRFKINEISGELMSMGFVDCGRFLVNISIFSMRNRITVDWAQIQITITSKTWRAL